MILYNGELYDCGTEEEAIALYNLAQNPSSRTEDEIAEDNLLLLRLRRDQLISETDWWANSDLTMTQAQIDYRQALRDITNSYSSYLDVVWPTKPE
jgi:hypothetical protein